MGGKIRKKTWLKKRRFFGGVFFAKGSPFRGLRRSKPTLVELRATIKSGCMRNFDSGKVWNQNEKFANQRRISD